MSNMKSTNIDRPNDALANLSEKRTEPRKRIIKSCKGTFNNGADSFDGKLVNLSISGCRLELSGDEKEFSNFDLKLVVSGLERPCEVKWRFNHFIGAEFIMPTKATKV